MSDEDLKRMSGHDAVMSLHKTDREVWLDITDEKRVSDALRVAIKHGEKTIECQIREGMSRRAARSSDSSADRRHGEEMLAAAHANRRANQALSVGVGALILALIAILQQCRG
jgi:hypothetical protein